MGKTGKPDIWMPLYIGDYLSDTAHLTTEQSGAYLHLLMHYWKTGPLPNHDVALAQICKLSADAWSIAQALLKPFFKLGEDGLLHQGRMDSELERWGAKKLSSKEKAEKAGRARWKNHASSNASSNASSTPQAMLERCPSPSPIKRAAFLIPEWVPAESWAGFVEMRQRIRAPLTKRAKELTIRALEKLRDDGHDPGSVLDQSATMGWRGVFELRQNGGKVNGAHSTGRLSPADERAQRRARTIEEFIGEES